MEYYCPGEETAGLLVLLIAATRACLCRDQGSPVVVQIVPPISEPPPTGLESRLTLEDPLDDGNRIVKMPGASKVIGLVQPEFGGWVVAPRRMSFGS